MNTSKAMVHFHLNGQAAQVAAGTSIAAALYLCGDGVARHSVSGQARAPVCGMGVCQECRVLVNGHSQLACQTLCAPGMVVETGAAA
jgi:aerobic-type carbon monoxide dehydrogenase small subunit (CoxS/CutS family)